MGRNYTDYHGYKRDGLKHNHSDLISRQIAHNQIYLPNKHEYSLPFSKYIVHHKDGNKLNNHASNLQIITQEEHEIIHGKSGNSSTSFGSMSEHGEYRNRNMSFGEMLSMIIVCVGTMFVYFGSHDFSKSPTQINYFTGTVAIGIGIILVAVAWLALSRPSTQAIFGLIALFILLAYSFGIYGLPTQSQSPEPWKYISTIVTVGDLDYISGVGNMTWDCSTSDENGRTIEDICPVQCSLIAPVGKWSFSSADCLERNKFQCNCKAKSNSTLCVNPAESSKIIDAECSNQCSLLEPVGKWSFSSADCKEPKKFQCNCKMRIK